MRCEAATFTQAVETVCRAVSPRNGFLSGVILRARDGTLSVSLSDGECGAAVTLHADGDLDAVVAVGLLKLFAARLPAGALEVTVEAGEVVFDVGTVHGSLPTSGVEAVSVPVLDVEPRAVAVAALQRLATVTYAASLDENRPILVGICSTGTRVQASDSYRAAIVDGLDLGVWLLPAAWLARVVPLCDDGEVVWRQDGRRVEIRTGRSRFVAPQIGGVFPNLDVLYPSTADAWPVVLRCDAKALAEALKLMSAVGLSPRESTRIVTFAAADDGCVTVGSAARERGAVRTVIAGEVGEMAGCGFSAGYLADLLDVADTPEFVLRAAGPDKPYYLHGDGHRHLLMPVRRP